MSVSLLSPSVPLSSDITLTGSTLPSLISKHNHATAFILERSICGANFIAAPTLQG